MRRALVLGAILLAACNPRPQANTKTAAERASSLPTSSPAPALHIRGKGNVHQPVVIIEQAKNRNIYELRAKSYESTVGAQGTGFKGRFSDTHVTFFEPNGTTLKADAPIALIDKSSQRVTLAEGVHAQTSTGIRLRCDTLTYERSTGRIHGEGNVRILQPSQGYDLSGGNFESDVELHDVHMGS